MLREGVGRCEREGACVQGTVVKGVAAGQLHSGGAAAAGGGLEAISQMIVTRTVHSRQQDMAVLLGAEALVCSTYPVTVIAKCVPSPCPTHPFRKCYPLAALAGFLMCCL